MPKYSVRSLTKRVKISVDLYSNSLLKVKVLIYLSEALLLKSLLSFMDFNFIPNRSAYIHTKFLLSQNVRGLPRSLETVQLNLEKKFSSLTLEEVL